MMSLFLPNNQKSLCNRFVFYFKTRNAANITTLLDINGTTLDTVTVLNLNVTNDIDINGGTIDGCTIATSDIIIGTGKALDQEETFSTMLFDY